MTDLAAVPLADAQLSEAHPSDAAELLVLQRCCWVPEAIANDTFEVPALHEDLDTVRGWIETARTWTIRLGGRLVAAVRARLEEDRWEIGRLMVAPDLAGQGLGRWLLAFAEQQAPPEASSLVLYTGAGSERNLTMYRRAGYQMTEPPANPLGKHIRGAVCLTKRT
ncbi:GNAT family N-acetyltransferase [Amycolatopsis orientalis]|uniref:GNAT family N-acetyltransferase n=1 Tax=Amycolatopsis orientalis TaxID=31958 RepID=UPI00039D84E9|nr:GNAT family N-acetyltransferase [Amycolatopsis orientalis]